MTLKKPSPHVPTPLPENGRERAQTPPAIPRQKLSPAGIHKLLTTEECPIATRPQPKTSRGGRSQRSLGEDSEP